MAGEHRAVSMFFFGHLGIGATMVRPWRQRLPFRWVLLGAVVPDVVDKLAYYGLAWTTGREGAGLGLISCTRTFGHTGLFLLLLFCLATVLGSPLSMALAAGAATHVVLDNLPSLATGTLTSANIALMYPFYEPRFAVMETHGLGEHLGATWKDPYIWATEAIGLGLLAWLHQQRDTWR